MNDWIEQQGSLLLIISAVNWEFCREYIKEWYKKCSDPNKLLKEKYQDQLRDVLLLPNWFFKKIVSLKKNCLLIAKAELFSPNLEKALFYFAVVFDIARG